MKGKCEQGRAFGKITKFRVDVLRKMKKTYQMCQNDKKDKNEWTEWTDMIK